MLLAALRPNVHCPHVGPTGGMKCVDKSIDQVLYDPTSNYLACKSP